MIAAMLGWIGTIGTFATYLMVSRGRMAVTSARYAYLNTAGGVLGGTASAMYGAWPSATANFAWAIVGLHSLWICTRRAPIQTLGDAVGQRNSENVCVQLASSGSASR